MVASVVLAASALGVSGSILASYASDEVSRARHDAVAAAAMLMAEITALPLDPLTTSDVSLADFAHYVDVVPVDRLNGAVLKVAATKPQPAVEKAATPSSGDGLVGSVVGTVGTLLVGDAATSSSSQSTSSNVASGGSGSTSSGSISTAAQTRVGSDVRVARRAVTVERRAAINGVATAGGRFAIVTVDVTLDEGTRVRLKRLVTSAEAAANTAG